MELLPEWKVTSDVDGKFENFGRGDPVWTLMESSRVIGASPCFARDVIRQVRNEMEVRQTVSWGAEAPRAWQWLMPLAACAMLALMAGFSVQRSGQRTAGIEAIDPGIEFEVVANLESYLAGRDNAIWLVESN